MRRYVEGQAVIKILLFIFFLSVSLQSVACLPCGENSIAVVIKQASPTFPIDYTHKEAYGSIRFSVDVVSSKQIKNIKILQVSPSDIPEDTLIKMINDSRFLPQSASQKLNFGACTVEAAEFTFEFMLPRKIEIDIGL